MIGKNVDQALKYLSDKTDVFLVGGALRDLLLGLLPTDFDLVVKGDSAGLARDLATACNGNYFLLDKEFNVSRVVLPDGNLHIDIATLQGSVITDDLRRRDFTCNAMAYPLENWSGLALALEKIIDPLSGLKDISKGILRAVSSQVFYDDPVRILRAVRISRERGWQIEAETERMMVQASAYIADAAKERTGEEFFKIMKLPQAAPVIDDLVERYKLLPVIWPEINDLQQTQQNHHHTVGAWQHCINTLVALEEILGEMPFPDKQRYLIEDYANEIISQGRTRRQLWKFVALFHDVGKSKTARVKKDGKITFYNHDRIGSDMIIAMGKRIALSNKELEAAKRMICGHMRPLLLSLERNLSKTAVYRFFRDYRVVFPDIMVLTLADNGSKYLGELGQSEQGTKYREFIFKLMDKYFFSTDYAPPEKLISGDRFQAMFPAIPVNQTGKWLNLIEEAQVNGDISTVGDLEQFVLRQSKKIKR